MNVRGIDVSRWQDNISTPQHVDFVRAKAAGVEFVFIKASQSIWQDRDILMNWENAHAAGLLRGAYHFLVWDVKPADQARFFCGLLKSDVGELPPVCDFEWWGTVPSTARQILWAFMQECEQLICKKPLLYTAPGFWQPYGSSNVAWAQYDLWIADYGVNNPSTPKSAPLVPTPWSTWRFWQYSSKGDGLAHGTESLNVDLNYFNGSLDDLYAYAGKALPVKVPTIDDRLMRVESFLTERFGYL